MRRRWDDESIAAALRPLIQKYQRMPSAAEMRVAGKNALACAITRRGGFEKWRRYMRASIKPSETTTGLRIQRVAARLLRAQGFRIDEQTTKAPFDLLVDGRVRVDVKSGSQYQNIGYIFALNKRTPTCDVYMLATLNSKQRPLTWYFVPSDKAKIVTLTITPNGKYAAYRGQIDLLRR
jgi:hypothetical protein